MADYIQKLTTWFGNYIVDTIPAASGRLHHFRFDTNTRKLFWSDNTVWKEVASGVAINETLGDVQLNPSGITGEGHFLNIQQEGSAASSDLDSSGYWLRLLSAASAGALAGFRHQANVLKSVRRSFEGWMSVKWQHTAADLPFTASRFILGLYDSTSLPPDSDTLLDDARSGFFIVARAGVDTNYKILHNDGTGPALEVDTGVAFPTAANIIHRIQIEWHPTDGMRWVIENISGSIQGRGVINTRIPATTTRIYMLGGIQANAKSFLFRHIKCKVGGH